MKFYYNLPYIKKNSIGCQKGILIFFRVISIPLIVVIVLHSLTIGNRVLQEVSPVNRKLCGSEQSSDCGYSEVKWRYSELPETLRCSIIHKYINSYILVLRKFE